MIQTENAILRTCLQLGVKTDYPLPESVILGFSRLLLMDESAVKNVLTDAELKDLEGARKVMTDNKLDLKLIKSGLLLLYPLIRPDEKQQKKIEEFTGFAGKAAAGTPSGEILARALAAAVLPVGEIFSVGQSMDQVFAYQAKLKAEDKKAAETAPKKEKIEGEKPEEKAPDKEKPKEKKKQEKVQVRDIESLSQTYRRLSSALLGVIKGQEQAVKKFVEGCFQGELFKQTEMRNHPRAYFFFFGPPGTGKTLLAETAAEALGLPCRKFDMSDYATSYAHEELIGTSQNYKNSRDGELVRYVAENPECLLIFDEIEKANIGVIRLFLTILGSGYLKSKHTEKNVSFRDTIIIFTSNVGRELYEDRSVNLSALPEKVLIDAIQREKNAFDQPALPSEICSRIAAGNTVLFNHLSIRHLAEIVTDNFDGVVRHMGQEYNCNVTYSPKLPLLFLYNRGSEIDARVASGQSGNFLKNEIYELTRQLENYEDRRKVTAIHFDVDWGNLDDEIRHLFINESSSEVIVMADKEILPYFRRNCANVQVHYAKSAEEARDLLKKHDITAVFIDPFFGKMENNDTVLSITDYNTLGVSFFYELVESEASIPIYLIEMDPSLSEVDRRTFLQEGAADTLQMTWNNQESFIRHFEQIMEELYMEKESQIFSQRGWIVDYKTRQDVAPNGQINIIFYDLKKKMAVDMESRGSLLSEAQRPNVKFDDVIGAQNAKEELRYFINYLREPKKFLLGGNKPPQGVLLYGPPGTGKTMLAKAMAGESDVHFIQATASEFANKWVGESEANIRRLFRRARTYAPAIIFIDEIDAIGKQRTGDDSNREAMLNTLLTEMQGFQGGDPNKPVFVLAATNFGVDGEGDGVGKLDEALVRRFDNRIKVDLPNEKERRAYIKRQLEEKKVVIGEDVISNVAERTPGKSLAILQNIIDLAFRNAGKAEKPMNGNDLLTAMEDYEHGEQKEYSEAYYRSVAIHETGHAYVSYLGGDCPSYITIESRANFGGYMQHANSEETPNYTREELLARIRTALAGRAAEQVFYGREKALNTGASSDLKQASNLAFHIICIYGMEENQYVVLSREEILKSSVAGDYIRQVNELLQREMTNTLALIEDGKDVIQAIADELLKENHLTGEQFKTLLRAYQTDLPQ